MLPLLKRKYFNYYNNIFQGQSVPRRTHQEYALTCVYVGHMFILRGCNTNNPATRIVSGVAVGHFGKQSFDSEVKGLEILVE